MPDMMDKPMEYWADLPAYSKEFAEKVCERFKAHMGSLEERGATERIRRAWCQYHSRDREGNYDTSEIYERGEGGGNIHVSPNEFRNIIRTKNAIALGRKLSFAPTALNSSSEALSATLKARTLLKHLVARGGLGKARYRAAETANVMMASWLGVWWDPLATPSDFVDTAMEKLAFSGQLTFPVFHPLQVAYDTKSPDITDPTWTIVEVQVNRYDFAARIGNDEKRDAVLRASSERCLGREAVDLDILFEDDDDYIRVLHVMHKKNVSRPQGRDAIVLDGETVLVDGDLAESRVPCFMLESSQDIGESGMPYGDDLDLLPIIELMQDAHSELGSMFAAMIAILWTPDGVEYTLEQFDNLKHVKGGTIPPEVLNLFTIRPEHYQYLSHLLQVAYRFAHLSGAMAGDVNAADSGSKLAYQSSVSMQQQQGFITALTRLMEQAASMAIEVIKLRMDEEMVVSIVGKGDMAETQRFTKADLEPIQSVLVEEADPASDTPEFRRAAADMAAQKGWIGSVSEWMTAYKAGTDVYSQDDTAKEILLRRENEQLREGDPRVTVTEADDHLSHIRGHAVELLDDAVRFSPELAQVFMTHMFEHMKHLTPGMDEFFPQLLLALGQEPLPATAGPDGAAAGPEMQPPGPDGAPMGAQGKAQGSPPAERGLSGRGPTLPGAAEMPPAPKNPGSGQSAPTPALDSAPVPPGATRS